MSDIPEGFRPLNFAMGFIEQCGPLYGKWVDEKFLLGFRVGLDELHTGPVMRADLLRRRQLEARPHHLRGAAHRAGGIHERDAQTLPGLERAIRHDLGAEP